MKTFSKFLSVLLSLMFVFSAVAMFGVGTNAATYSGSYEETFYECDQYYTETTNWEFDDSTNTMTFSGDGDIMASSIPSYAEKIEIIVIKPGVGLRANGLDGFPNLKAVYVDENHESYMSVDGVLYGKEQKGLEKYPPKKSGKSYTIPDSVTGIGDNAFKDCTELTEIKIPDSLRRIGSDAFDNSGCWNDSSNWDGNVLYIDNVLVDFDSSKTDISGHYNIRAGTRMVLNSYVFSSSNDKITGISIPDTVNYIAALSTYSGLSQGIVNNEAYWYEGACYIDNCLIAVKKDLSGHLMIKEGTRIIAEEVLGDSSRLSTITFPGSIKTIPSLEGSEFNNPNKTITTIYINEGVEVIEDNAFYNFEGLKSVSFPKSLKKIDAGCIGVFSTESGYSYNEYVPKITLSYAGTMSEWENIEIVGAYRVDDFKQYATIHCSDGIINEPVPPTQYQSDTGIPTEGIIIIAAVTIILIAVAIVIIVKIKKKNKNKEYKTLS